MSKPRPRVLARGEFTDLLAATPAFRSLCSPMTAPPRGGFNSRQSRESDAFTIAVFGKCGHGKSSLLNALIGEDLFRTSHIEVGTKTAQSVEYRLSGFARSRLTILDLPGIGETDGKNDSHFDLYRTMLKTVSSVIYVLRADQRDLAVDQWLFSQIFAKRSRRRRVTVALSQIDKVHPLNRARPFSLTSEQRQNVTAKIKTVQRALHVAARQIVPVASTESYGVKSLIENVAAGMDPSLRKADLVNSFLDKQFRKHR